MQPGKNVECVHRIKCVKVRTLLEKMRDLHVRKNYEDMRLFDTRSHYVFIRCLHKVPSKMGIFMTDQRLSLALADFDRYGLTRRSPPISVVSCHCRRLAEQDRVILSCDQ